MRVPWGTALAATASRAGAEATLWGRAADVVKDIEERHVNGPLSRRGSRCPRHCARTTAMAAALATADARHDRGSLRLGARDRTRHGRCPCARACRLPFCAKGIEAETGLLMTQVAEQELPGHPVGVVSGPTFARETVLNHPTAATVAFPFAYADRLAPQSSVAARFAVSLTTGSFRAYVSDDLVGVEIGGAVKNVIAIACGMMAGAGFAENTRAALITRGVDEMKALAEVLGGRRETVTGLSGIGDLALTCSSTTSRNMSLGRQLGEGVPRAACFGGTPVVVEGEHNARTVTDLARRLGVTMPICETVRAILHDGAGIGVSFAALWARPIEAEPRMMDVAFRHPASEEDIATLAERMS